MIHATRPALLPGAGTDADPCQQMPAATTAVRDGMAETHRAPPRAAHRDLDHERRASGRPPFDIAPDEAAAVLRSSADASPPATAHRADAPSPRRRALVVDDNADAADTLAMMLELLGHEARAIHDPRAAVEALAQFRPQIVFLDIGMPVLDGYELARRLRAAPGGDELVLVAVTGWGQPEDRRRTRDAGFDHHLVKPPEINAIRQACMTTAGGTAVS